MLTDAALEEAEVAGIQRVSGSDRVLADRWCMVSRTPLPRSRWGSVFLRSRTWYIKFRWPRGGRAWVRAVGPDRHRAHERLRASELRLRNGVPITEVLAAFRAPERPQSFRQVVDSYLLDALRRKRTKTLAAQGAHLRLVRGARWASKGLEEVTWIDLQDWLDVMQDRRKLADPTVNRYASSISAVFRWAGKRRLCPRIFNPARELEWRPESSGRENFMTPSELEAWIAAAPDHFRTMALFYARTGVRRDEARMLRWDSVDFARRVVRIKSADAKNGMAREIVMTPDLADALDRCARKRGSSEFVFCHRGRPWSTHRQYTAFRATVRDATAIPEAKRDQLRLHDIRHTVGAILASNGVSLEVIGKLLGHKSLESSRRYAHIMPSAIAHAADVLAAAVPASEQHVRGQLSSEARGHGS